jgi:ribosomal-protein-alanine N-acetyltransferase
VPAAPRRPPVLVTPRLVLRLPDADDAPAIARYYDGNRAHLGPWEPVRSDDFYTEAFWRRQVAHIHGEFIQDRSCRFFLFDRTAEESREGDERSVVGNAGLSHIVRGVGQFATLGYGLGAEWQGRGLMFEALQAVIACAFSDLGLHRVQANYIPRNERSGRLLRRLGFGVEGYARDYLHVAGRWEDHLLTALVNPDWSTAHDP